ncbi:hypothetical protein FA95DRAFT_1503220, partial [Auriscalpium vulgare]
RAIRLNWLCNPTGKRGKFRAIDWLVERNNLYTKSIYGGKNSNHTVSRIIDESAIIETYQSCIDNMETNFQLTSRTVSHTDPGMQRTLAKLAEYIKEHAPHEQKPGRKVAYEIVNKMSKGLDILSEQAIDSEDEMEVDESDRDEDDVMFDVVSGPLPQTDEPDEADVDEAEVEAEDLVD